MSLPKFITESYLYNYGESWLQYYANELGIKLDESKFALGEGYYVYIQHFGATDPLIGGIEGPFWYEDKDLFLGVIDYFHKTEKWTKYLKDELTNTDICDELGVTEDELDAMTLEELYSMLMDSNFSGFFVERIVDATGDKELQVTLDENCLLGITDKEYLTSIIMKFIDAGYEFFDEDLDNISYAKVTG